MTTGKECGEALKTIFKRLQEQESNESKELKHICHNCKYRKTETYITQDWGHEQVWHNWCGLDKKYMETKFSQGNGIHFSEPCENFVERNNENNSRQNA